MHVQCLAKLLAPFEKANIFFSVKDYKASGAMILLHMEENNTPNIPTMYYYQKIRHDTAKPQNVQNVLCINVGTLVLWCSNIW